MNAILISLLVVSGGNPPPEERIASPVVLRANLLTDDRIDFDWPSPKIKGLFWDTLLDVCWPSERDPELRAQWLMKHFEPYLADETGEFEDVPIGRKGFFDEYAPETARRLRRHNILLFLPLSPAIAEPAAERPARHY